MSEWRLNYTDGGVMVRLCHKPIITDEFRGERVGEKMDCVCQFTKDDPHRCQQKAYFRGPDAEDQAKAYLIRNNPNGKMAQTAKEAK